MGGKITIPTTSSLKTAGLVIAQQLLFYSPESSKGHHAHLKILLLDQYL